jgi:aryl-alcohol dehydrogenase-like predicted oxidoreductase
MNERIALGSVQFGLTYGVANQSGKVTSEEAGRIIAAAYSFGMRTLDTAIAYGTSESVIGSCGVTDWDIVTKLPAVPDHCDDVQEWSIKQIEGSLNRLNVNSVYGVMLHRPDQLFGACGKELLRSLQLIKIAGYTKKIGVSIYDPDQLNHIISLGVIDLVQAPLSVLDRRIVESGWAQQLHNLGIELHARSIFLQGLLLMSTAHRPLKFKRWSGIWEEWARWLQMSGLNPLQACLRYALSVREVDRIVIGVDSLSHLHELLSVTKSELQDLPQWPSVPEVELINPSLWNLI